MPVFYLAVLLVGGVVGIRQWLTPASLSSARPDVASVAQPPSKPRVSAPVDAPQPPSKPAEDDGILRTADGLRRKVLVKDLDVVCRDEPVGGSPVGPPLDYFSIRFVYGESPPDAPTMVRIGPRGGPPQGWIPRDSVLEWDTRLMARPTPREGRPPIVIYAEEPCLIEALGDRKCSRHPEGCPTEGEEGNSGSGVPTLGMPILRSREVQPASGPACTIFEVASLVRDQAPRILPAAPTADLLPLLRRVEVAFAIDTTASMKDTIDSARRLAEQLVSDASTRHRDVTLRLGLVEYRDKSPAFGFSRRIVTHFTDPSRFLAALATLEAAKRGDGSIEESVYDGIDMALPPSPGEPAGTSHLDWSSGRPGELATKILVLLGDAPDRDRDLEHARALAGRAKEAGITLATITLDRPGALSKEEQARYQAQWKELAGGSFLPLDKASGFTERVAPVFSSLKDAGQLVPLLQVIIDDRIEYARGLAALAAAEAEGRLSDYVNSQGLTLDRVAPVLVDLHRGESAEAPRPDPRFNGRKAPSVRKGWIAETRGEKPQVSVEILMSRDELGQLIGELSQLQQATQGTAREIGDLLRIGNAAMTGESGFLASDRGLGTFADHLRQRREFPPARADSLFRRTQTDLLRSDELYRAALDARLGSSLAELLRLRGSPDWDDPKRTIEGMALVPYRLFDY